MALSEHAETIALDPWGNPVAGPPAPAPAATLPNVTSSEDDLRTAAEEAAAAAGLTDMAQTDRDGRRIPSTLSVMRDPRYAKVRTERKNPDFKPVQMAEADFRGYAPGDIEVDTDVIDRMVPHVRAGESIMDYWSRVPEGMPAPMQGESVEDYDLRLRSTAAQEQLDAKEDILLHNQDPRTWGREPGAPGLAEGTRQAVEGIGEANVAQAQAVADVYGGAQEQHAQEMEAVSKAELQRREYLRHVSEAERVILNTEKEARKILQERPEVDSQRFFKSMTGVQKFFAVIGAMAGGWNHSNATMDTLMKMAEADLDEQKANWEIASQKYDVAHGSVNQAMEVYGRIRNAVNDERVADAQWLKFTYEDLMFQIDTVIAQTNVPKVKAEFQKLRAATEEQIRVQDAQIEFAKQSTPEKIVRYSRRNAEEFREMMRLAKSADDNFWEAQKLDHASREKFALERVKAGLEMEKAAGTGRDKAWHGEHGYIAQLSKFSDKTDVEQQVWKNVDSFIMDYEGKDIAGRGGSRMVDWSDPNARADVRRQLLEIMDTWARSRSGAALTEYEIDHYKELLGEGYGDEQLIDNLRYIQTSIARGIQSHWVGQLEDEAQAEWYRRTKKTKDPHGERLFYFLTESQRSDGDRPDFIRPRSQKFSGKQNVRLAAPREDGSYTPLEITPVRKPLPANNSKVGGFSGFGL